MRKPTPKMIEALVWLFSRRYTGPSTIGPRITVGTWAGLVERGLITPGFEHELTTEAGETGLAFLIETKRAVVAQDGSWVYAQVAPMTDDEITATLIRFEAERAADAEMLAKADAIREAKSTPEFPVGLKLRHPATGTTFEVVEHTHAVRLRNVSTGVMSALPQDLARELDRIAEAEESDRVHEDANRAWANTLRAEVRAAVAALPLGAPVVRKLDGERGNVVAHHDLTVEVELAGRTVAGAPAAFELDTDPTALWFGEPETYLTDVDVAWNLAWSMWNALAIMAGGTSGAYYASAITNPGHPARPALDALEGMGFVHAWNDGTGYDITPAGERADRHRHPVVVGSTVVNVLADGSTVVDVVDDEKPAVESSPFEGLDALRARNAEADLDRAALGETTADVISDTMKLLTGRITPAEYDAPARTLPELADRFDDAVAQIVAAIPADRLADAAGALSSIERPRDCGWVWVAEIGLCPRCGLNAEAHSGNTEHAYGATSRPLPVTGFLPALNAALTPGEAELLDGVDTSDVVEGSRLTSAAQIVRAIPLVSRGIAYRGSTADRPFYLTAVGAELVKYRRALSAAAKGSEYAAYIATNYGAQALSPLNVVPMPAGFEAAGDGPLSDSVVPTEQAALNVRQTMMRLRRGLVLTSGDRVALADLLDTVRRSLTEDAHAVNAWSFAANTYRAHFGDSR